MTTEDTSRPRRRPRPAPERVGRIPTQLAYAAAEHLRQLNATVDDQQNGASDRGYATPREVHLTVADLAKVTHSIGQALEQASQWLQAEDDAGRITDGPPPTSTAIDALIAAKAQVETAATALDAAAVQSGHFTHLEPESRD